MKGYRKLKLYRLSLFLAVLFILGTNVFSQEQPVSGISSGGGFSIGEGYTNFSIVGGGPVNQSISGGDFLANIGLLYNGIYSYFPDLNMYTEAFPQGAGIVTGAGIYKQGERIQVSATPDSGWVFIGWGSPAGVFEDVNNPSTLFTMPGEDVTLIAYFDQSIDSGSTSIVTVNAFPESYGSIAGSGKYLNGATLNLKALPSHGYRFVSWTDSGVIVHTKPEYSFTVNGDRTLVANYALEMYTIKLESSPLNNIGGAVKGAGKYPYGTELTISANQNLGFTFEGWIERGDTVSNDQTYTFTVDSDHKITGQFSGQQYSIGTNVSPLATGTVNGAGNYYTGDIVELTANPADGYYFVRWLQDSVQLSVRNPYLFTASDDRNLTAEFAEIWWADKDSLSQSKSDASLVTATTTPSNIGIVIGQGNYLQGENVTLTASPNKGISFVKWMENGVDLLNESNELIGAELTFTANGSRELLAVFDGAEYIVQAGSDPAEAGTTTVSNDGSFFPGDLAELSTTSNPGYEFLNWTLQDGQQVSVNPLYKFTVAEDRELVANYAELQKFTLSINVVPEGSAIVSGEGTYTTGSEIAISAIPDEKYGFVYWSKNAELISSASDTIIRIDSDMEITAYLELKSYKLSYGTDGNGSISGDSLQIINYGKTAGKVEAIPDNCYAFVEWSDGSTSNPRTDSSITGDISVTARFEEILLDASVMQTGDSLIANASGATYQWLDCDNNNLPIDGATDQTFIPDTCGNYALMVMVDGCQVISECFNILVDATGIENSLNDTFGFKVYPNPGKELITIESGSEASFVLVNSLGQKIRQFELNSLGAYRVKISDLDPGVYVLIGQTGNEIHTKRVIISR